MSPISRHQPPTPPRRPDPDQRRPAPPPPPPPTGLPRVRVVSPPDEYIVKFQIDSPLRFAAAVALGWLIGRRVR